jgi:hypothetical protein
MTTKLKLDLHHAVLPFTLDGRKTVPAVGLDDKAFRYVPAIQTNLAETFRKARAQLTTLKTV